MTFSRRTAALLLLLLGFHVAAAEPADPGLAYLGGKRLLRVSVRGKLDGKTLETVWQEGFRRLFTNLDQDANGKLDRTEALRVPAAMRVRQLSWGYFFTDPGPTVQWSELAAKPEDKTLSFDQLVAYYRRHGVGAIQIMAGVSPRTEALGRALVQRLDANRDSKLTQAEVQQAAKCLAALDLNEDELLSPTELLDDPARGEPQAVLLQTPPSSSSHTPGTPAAFPFLRLPAVAADTHWTKTIIQRRDQDGDGQLTVEEVGLTDKEYRQLDANDNGRLGTSELIRWRELPADSELTVRFGKRGDQPALEWRSGDVRAVAEPGELLRFELGGAAVAMGITKGTLMAGFATSRKTALERFAEADANRDDSLDAGEVGRSTYPPLRLLATQADRDGDGKLSRTEWDGWLYVLEGLVTGQMVVSIVDQQNGLFDLLDADRDGRLSVRELRNAWTRLRASGCVAGDTFQSEKLPRHLIGAAAIGAPQLPPVLTQRPGPDWFRALDRNKDGDVSRREWLGTDADFRRADVDGDGFIDAAEAERLVRKQP